MIVRMLTHMAGPLISYEVGQEITMPDQAAERFIRAGFAEKVDTKPVAENVERATRKPKAETR